MATGFKLQDALLLSECISSAATARSHAEQVMQDAAQRLRGNILFEEPDNIKNGDGETDIAHVAVTVDVDTGEIQDYEVKSLFCHECKAHSAEDKEIRKEECVGHVQKRLGTALRKYKNDHKGKKLSDGKSVGGKGRLTDKTIDKMQNYYGKAIRENKGNLQEMKRSIKAIQHHIIRDDSKPLQEQHHYCPRSRDTWCKYWKDINEGTSTYSEDNRLPPVFMEELEPTFTRLSNYDLLLRCLKGMTQNQNESANGMLWSKCPKTKFCGARRVRIAACETVAVFNTGAASKAMFMVLCGVTPGENSIRALRLQDRVRFQTAAKKVAEKYKNQRRKLCAMQKSKGDKESYQPGGFSLSSQPDLQEKKKKRKRTVKDKDGSSMEIAVPTTDVASKDLNHLMLLTVVGMYTYI
ncbi:uncharacterized protein LOC114528348 [Dendronephthya gigantea]|uniref:uncharacterized protein LOC114528348 n=1 Tax=Dendronephthya gigantea TaxID=151771 RepID=UPI0010690BDC|nr:uncharacterized protein LOC114528348 [Dendronephthya gigantea]